jgi:hypothetical protein
MSDVTTGTLGPVSGQGNGGDTASRRRMRRWGTGRSDPVAAFLSPRLGLAPKTIEHMLRHGPRAVNELAAEIVRAFLTLGDHVRLARFLAPIRAAEAGFKPALSSELVQRAQHADAVEEISESAYLLSHDRAELARWKHRLELQLATTLELLTAIESRLENA